MKTTPKKETQLPLPLPNRLNGFPWATHHIPRLSRPRDFSLVATRRTITGAHF